MPSAIDDQVVDFYYALFDHVFSDPFRSGISKRLRRDGVIGKVQESARAASQSLIRFFLKRFALRILRCGLNSLDWPEN